MGIATTPSPEPSAPPTQHQQRSQPEIACTKWSKGKVCNDCGYAGLVRVYTYERGEPPKVSGMGSYDEVCHACGSENLSVATVRLWFNARRTGLVPANETRVELKQAKGSDLIPRTP